MNKAFLRIYNETHLQETSFDTLKEDSKLRSIFEDYNEKYFNNSLIEAPDKIGWTLRRVSTFAGAYHYDVYGNTWLEINPILKDHMDSEYFTDTFVHEMIHIICFDHGPDFLREADRINKEFGLHITTVIDQSTELHQFLKEYEDEKLAKRADRINNNVNKSDLQNMFDKLNDKYFEGKLPSNVILKYLPTKTFKTYALSQVRADKDSDWIFELKVARNNTEKCMLLGLIYIYVADVLKTPKKDINRKVEEMRTQLCS